MTQATLAEKLTAWQTAIDTQKHFNDICVRTRQFGFGFVVAALGLAVVLINQFEDAFINLKWFSLHISIFVVFSAIIALVAIWILDLGVYHRLLRGSVKFAEQLEKSMFKAEIFGISEGLATYISAFSRHKKASVIDGSIQRAGKTINAEHRIARFYLFCVLSLVVISFVIGFGIRPN